MDADALQSPDRRFHYGFAAAMLTGTLAWVLAPGDVVLVSLVGLPVVIFFGAATIGVANGQWTEAAGYLVATVGWCLVLASVVD